MPSESTTDLARRLRERARLTRLANSWLVVLVDGADLERVCTALLEREAKLREIEALCGKATSDPHSYPALFVDSLLRIINRTEGDDA